MSELQYDEKTHRYEPEEGDSDMDKKSLTPFKKIKLAFFRMQTMIHTEQGQTKRILLGLFIVLFLFFWISDSAIPNGIIDQKIQESSDLSSKGSTSRWLKKNKDPRFVIILAANEGGGVLRWKNEQEWAIEHISIANKEAYAKRHGYGLTIKDLTTVKRYSHEFREGWQKADILKQTMREFPGTEWFWWLDLDTLIMEPEKSLEEHIFNRIDKITDRTLKSFNPLNLDLDQPYVDYTEDIDLLITQDCGGFNLGSFFIKNSDWSKLLLDIWWDPISYEQKHMVWEHREQDALESLYANEAWIRSKIGFLPLRSINAFPPGACSEFSDDPRYFYNQKDRDFVVNMAGCNFGRDCWGEIQYYADLMKKLNTKWYTRFFF
ncbi:alpha-1,6-mannosyltransferase [Maudiozyma humilis]|uniref:Alpha-1,6-mannosyltransferase n=1 Tax=Maudiozyma humilis TaxID=51915 RepID=A0AAV5S085_MAUHU|nr:alpha-1,6-mannosyltransferase [Kazachstania humilis]